MSVRAKAFVASKINRGTEENPMWDVSFYGVFTTQEGIEGNATEENRKFGEFTPMFSVSMTITNPDAADQLEMKKEYYVDFTPAE